MNMGERLKRHWALYVVLGFQVILTFSWLWRYAPSNDEALYLRVGREELAAWFHHGRIPGRIPSSYFSGAPFGWPILGGAADNLGGLTAARAVCLVLMLIVTALTYFIALRLSGRRQVAALAAGFAGLTGVLDYLGSSATFEPLALAILMAATWLTVRAKGDWRFYAVSGEVLFASNLAKYGTVAWIPIVAAIAFLTCGGDWKFKVRNGVIVAGTAIILDAIFFFSAGRNYRHGIELTTISRHNAPSTVANSSGIVLAHWTMLVGGILVFAIFGIAMSWFAKHDWRTVSLMSVLTLGLLIPVIDQARLGQIWSLDRNSAFGVPFGAIAAGFGLSYIAEWLASRSSIRTSQWAAIVPLALLMLFGTIHPWEAHGNPAKYMRLASMIEQHYRKGTFIGASGSGNVVQFYTANRIPPGRWLSVSRSQFVKELKRNKVSVVVLHWIQQSPNEEARTIALISGKPGWKLYSRFGKGHGEVQIWGYTPHHSHHRHHHSNHRHHQSRKG